METFANFTAISTLAGGIDSSETTLTVADGSGFETGGNLRILIDDELLLVTDVVGDVLTVTRHIENTTPASHANGADVNPAFTAGGLNQALSEVGSGDVIGPSSSGDSKVVLFDGTDGKKIKDSGLSLSGNNTGDQTSIVGITGSLAEFNTALTGADFATGGGTVSGASSGTNTGDQDISGLASTSSVNAALALKANLASPTFTGTPEAPTQSQGNNSTRLATTEYVDTGLAALIAASDAMVFKGVIDCSANPNYPAADRGHTYRVSVAGKIGGASGTNVEAGDLLLCLTDSTASGNQATVGSSWTIAQANLDGAVIGPSSSTAHRIARLADTSGKVLEENAANGIALNEIAQQAGLSILGVAGNATADMAAIVAALDGQIFRRSGTSVGFGFLDLASPNAVTGLLPYASLAPIPLSEVWVHTGNGLGSVGTKIRRFSTALVNVGTAITYADSSTNGATFTINETGYYALERTDFASTGSYHIGFSVNASSLTTAVESTAIGTRLISVVTPGANLTGSVGVVLKLTAGDVIRCHDGTSVSTSTGSLTTCRIKRVA